MTNRRPLRRTILQSGVRFFKDALVFILLTFLLESEYDASLSEVVGAHLDLHLVSGQDFDVVHAHLAGDVRGDLMAVLQLHAEHGIGERFNNLTVLLDSGLFCHIVILGF